MKRCYPLLAALALALAGCAETVTRGETPRILAMGDSMMAWHEASRKSISDSISFELGEPVINRSVSGARVIYPLPVSGALGMRISSQYTPGRWDWIVLNGGGNDLWLGCGCVLCDGKIDRLISADGQIGEIPGMVAGLRGTGARVIYVGYLRSPGRGSIIEHCRDDGNELERRIGRMAALMEGVDFLSIADMVPYGDRSYHSADMIHPSAKASAEIGRRVAAFIRTAQTAS